MLCALGALGERKVAQGSDEQTAPGEGTQRECVLRSGVDKEVCLNLQSDWSRAETPARVNLSVCQITELQGKTNNFA